MAPAARRRRTHLAAFAGGSQPGKLLGMAHGTPAFRELRDGVDRFGACRSSVMNSFLVTIPAVVGAVAFASMAGFALAKHEFKGSRLLLMIFIGGNLVPFQALMIPVRDLVIALGSTIRAGPSSCFTSPSRRVSARCSCATSSARFRTTPSTPRGRGRGSSSFSGASSCRSSGPRSPASRCWFSPLSGTTISGRWSWCNRTPSDR